MVKSNRNSYSLIIGFGSASGELELPITAYSQHFAKMNAVRTRREYAGRYAPFGPYKRGKEE